MWKRHMTAAIVLATAAVLPAQALAPAPPERFDPSKVSPAGYFAGPDARLSDEHRGWRVIICARETRNLDERGRNDALSRKNAVGRCQVLLSTAREIGYVGPTYALFFDRVNEEAADRVVAACLGRRGWKKTLHFVAYCFAGGPRRAWREGSEWYYYALNVEALYERRNGG